MEEDEGAAVLRQLTGPFQELCDLYGSPSSRYFFLDLDNSLLDVSYCSFTLGGRSKNSKMIGLSKSPPAKKSRKEMNREKATADVGSPETMESKIWKEFPEDLFEAVIARLPIATFFRFRSVCQKWNRLVTSQSFTQHFSEVSQELPWFYTITHENVYNGAMLDPSLMKWYHPFIPSLPERMTFIPVTSAGGLVCFLDIGHKHFFVCNPLALSSKELPPRPDRDWSRIVVGMTLNGDSTSKGYKIMWLECNGDHEIYDSVKGCWTSPGPMPSHIKLPLSLNFRSQAVPVGSTLYFMRAAPDGIISYDMVSGEWKQFIIPCPSHLTDHTLAECGGRIVLVGLLSKNAATCICIWELQKMTFLWKEVDRMPNIWCLEFYGRHVRMTCLGNRRLLMLSLRSKQLNRLVTYDLLNREWQKVPSCVPSAGKKKQWIACGTAFHPCPTAFA